MVSGEEPSGSSGGEKSMEDLILQTIDSVSKKILGEGSANIIIIYAKKSDPSKWEKDPDKVKVFVDALRNLIGFSSQIIENLILKNLYSRLELNFEEKENYDFCDYIMDLGKRRS